MIITPDVIKDLNTVFNKKFQDGLKLAKPVYTQIATVVKSTTASNSYGFLGNFPMFREWVGQRVFKDMKADAFQIVNRLFESTVNVPRTHIEDDNLGIYSPIMQRLGTMAAAHPDKLIFELLKLGEITLCYDGQNFFDDHPVYPNVDGTGTPVMVSNLFNAATPGAAWYLFDTSQVVQAMIYQERTAPELESKTSSGTSDHAFLFDEYLYGGRARGSAGFGLWQLCFKCTEPLTAENFEKVRLAMRSLKADGGEPLDVNPNLLVVPPSLFGAAKTIVGTEKVNGTDNPNYKLADILEVARLAD
jgi:phage major head subunit gpT-like protein